MNYEFWMAKRLRVATDDRANRSAVFSLKIATVGIVLAIVVMILSIAIVSGFKTAVVDKVSGLEAHIKITNGSYEAATGSVDSIRYIPQLDKQLRHNDSVASIALVAEKPCVLKTPDNFNGITFKGVSPEFDLSFISQMLKEGTANISNNRILVSELICNRLNLKLNDKINVYFIDNEHVRMRKYTIGGIYNTDFEDFDKAFVIGAASVVQQLNGWDSLTGTSIEINCKNLDEVDGINQDVIRLLSRIVYSGKSDINYQIGTIKQNASLYFAWLDLLDLNIAVILILMNFVACFSLIAGLLIIVLNRINMIGVLKALGAGNKSIRRIFIYLAEKLIFKAMIWGNAIGFAIIFLQQQFHIVRLSAADYYMSYVPVEINWWLLVLNAGIIVVASAALIAPSHIISTIKPAKSLRFE